MTAFDFAACPLARPSLLACPSVRSTTVHTVYAFRQKCVPLCSAVRSDPVSQRGSRDPVQDGRGRGGGGGAGGALGVKGGLAAARRAVGECHEVGGGLSATERK
eukprot:1858614-Pleurochrysis_carterae.AAC.1